MENGKDALERKYAECPEFYSQIQYYGFDTSCLPGGADLDNYVWATNSGWVFYGAEPGHGTCIAIKCKDISNYTLEDFKKIFIDPRDKKFHRMYEYETADDMLKDLQEFGVAELIMNMFFTGDIGKIIEFKAEYEPKKIVKSEA